MDKVIVGDALTELDFAYAAGTIDSDGMIAIRTNKSYEGYQITYSIRVMVKQTDPQALQLLSSLFGGNVRKDLRPSRKERRQMYVWELSCKKAEEALKKLLPFLRIKKEQAEKCLELQELNRISRKERISPNRKHRGASCRPKWITDKMEQLKQKVHQLKKRTYE